MSIVDLKMIMSILKLANDAPASHECLNKDANVPSAVGRKLLQKFQDEELINVQDGKVETSSLQRVRLAVLAVHCGADVEQVSTLLHWKEFEGIAAEILERNGYATERNVRFSQHGRRREVDVVGCRRPIIVCVDCKHWRRGLKASSLEKIVEEQIERTSALAQWLPSPKSKIKCARWSEAELVPVILSLVPGRLKFHKEVPVVAVLQFQDFLNELPTCVGSLYHVRWLRPEQSLS